MAYFLVTMLSSESVLFLICTIFFFPKFEGYIWNALIIRMQKKPSPKLNPQRKIIMKKSLLTLFLLFSYLNGFTQSIDWEAVKDRYYEKYNPTANPDWLFPLIFKDGLGNRDTIYFGMDEGAHDGMNWLPDSIYGEEHVYADSFSFTAFWSDCNDCDTLSLNKVNMAKEGIAVYSINFRNALKPVTLYYDPSALYDPILPFPDSSPAPSAWIHVFIDDFDVAISNEPGGSWCNWVNTLYLTDNWPQVNFDDCAFRDSMTIIWQEESQYMGQLGFGIEPWGLLTSTKEIKKEITITPNPVRDRIYLSFEEASTEGGSITIYDLFGRVSFRAKTIQQKEQEINVDGLASGIYFLEIKIGNSYQIEKIFITI